jgi:hypothetical protein
MVNGIDKFVKSLEEFIIEHEKIFELIDADLRELI